MYSCTRSTHFVPIVARVPMGKGDGITIYEPNHILKKGALVWPEMVRELIDARGLLWRLVMRDISVRYRQSFLGILWAFLTPLALMFAFLFIQSLKILPISGTAMPYAAFLFLGQMVWLFFSHGVSSSTNALVDAGALLNKINFPREVLVLSSVGLAIFEFALRIPLLLLVFLSVGFVPKPAILLVPFILLPLMLLVLGVGFCLSLFNALFRDVGAIVGIVLTLGMFAAPIVYPSPTRWPFSFLVNHVNPISAFVTAARDLAFLGRLGDPQGYAMASLGSFLIFLVSWRFFHLVEPRIAEKV